MTKHNHRSLIAAVALASAFATGPPLIASGANDAAVSVDEDNYRLLGLRLGQLSLADSLEGYEIGGGVCVDLQQLAEALEFPIDVDAVAGTAAGWFRDETRPFSLDVAALRVNGTAYPASGVLRSPQGLCVDTALAGQWFGLALTPDLPNALLIAKSDDKLPVEIAAERKKRRAQFRPSSEPDLSKFPHADTPYAMWRTPAVDLVASGGFVDDVSRDEHRAIGQYELFASGEALRLSFDTRFASNEEAEPESLRTKAFRKSSEADLLGPLRATEFAVGDVYGYGSALASENSFGRGGYVTNQPLGRAQTFDRTEFRGDLPRGWDAELYRNGQLIAFHEPRADGRYEFLDVPMLYGINRFEVVLYGRQGQVRRERRTINVGGESVPAGQTYYWFGALQNQKDLLTLKDTAGSSENHDLRASAVIEHGIDRKTSASLQLHTLTPLDDESITYVEGSVRRIVGAAMIELDFAAGLDGGVAFGGQFIAEFGKTYITGQTIWADSFVSDRIDPGVKSQHSVAIDHYFDLGATTLPVGVKLAYKDWAGNRSDTLDVATRMSVQLAGLSLTHEVAWQHYSGAHGAGGDEQLVTALLVGGRVGDVRLRGEARYRLEPDKQLESVSLTAEKSIGERSDLRGELNYEGYYDRARFGVGYSRQFDRFALGARAEAATDGSIAAGLNLAMSFGPGGNGRFARVTSTKLATSGQAAARVYTDSNRDGRWETGEPLHEGVSIAAGTALAETPTASDGTTIVDSLRTYQPQLLSIDTSTLADPLLRPAVRGVVIVPRPGVVQPVEFALLPTGEVEGMLYMESGGETHPRAGADLELVDTSSIVVAETRSDFDGFFLFQDVVYGQYRLRLGAATAKALGIAQRVLADVTIGEPDAVVRAGSILIAVEPRLALDLAALDADSSVRFSAP